ncbi:MAG: hypothetical protein VCG02_05690 [Verrucomicrobiota bacterium]
MTDKHTKKKSKNWSLPPAGPDHPIYSEGWTIGSGRLFSQLAKPSQEKDGEEDEEEPADKL